MALPGPVDGLFVFGNVSTIYLFTLLLKKKMKPVYCIWKVLKETLKEKYKMQNFVF